MSPETFRKLLVVVLATTAPFLIGARGTAIGLGIALIFWTFFPVRSSNEQ